jgi:hypothetical protein
MTGETAIAEVSEAPARRRFGLEILLLVAATLVPLYAGLSIDARYPGDDPLITLTYAKNLARGDGFVFNHQPPTLGTTSPALALACAAGTVLTPLEPTDVAQLIGVACWIGLVWVFWLFAEALGLSRPTAAVIGALMAARGWPEHLSMEAVPFALLAVLAVVAAASGRPLVGGLLTGLLFLVRGEGLLFAGILSVAMVAEEWTRRRDTDRPPSALPRYLAGVAAVVVLWTAYAMPTFGAILPNTLSAKIAQVESGLWAPFASRLVAEWIPSWTAGLQPWFVDPLVVLAVIGAMLIAWRLPRMAVLVLWGGAYAGAYHLLGVPGYPWYRIPVEWALLICAGVGLGIAAEAAVGSDPKRRARRWAVAAVTVVALVLLAVPTVRRIHGWQPTDRDLAYGRLTAWLNDHAAPSERVAFFEVGILGYATDLGVLDQIGLVSPELTPNVVHGDFGTGVWLQRPEYFVELEGSGFSGAVTRYPGFAEAYEPVAVVARLGGKRLIVYRARNS